jgi:RAB protein geranylgeranyltransferase component A
MSENVARDEEGLLSKYDVVICGTGLIQSILASALTRAGKSVLHCDAEGYYGELDAVLTLPYINHGEVWQDHTPHGGN